MPSKFKSGVPSVAVCMLMASCSTAPVSGEKASSADSVHAQASSAESHYQQLMSGSPQQVAALTLFLNRMPKGGDLHHHYSGAIYAETYLDWMAKAGYCVYKADNPETAGKQYKIEKAAKNLQKLAQVKTHKVCLSSDEIVADNGFYRDLLSVWSNKDFHNHVDLQPPPDKQFFDTFGFFGDISDYSYVEGLKVIRQYARQENVQYIETMLESSPSISCPSVAARLNTLSGQSSDSEIEDALDACFGYLNQDANNRKLVSDYVNKLETLEKQISDNQFTVRFQTYTRRTLNPADVFARLYFAFAADKASADIVGINLVGPENDPVAMRDYLLHMKMLRFLRSRYPESRLSLHSGELAMGMVPPDGLRYHIDTAVRIAGAQRIGHGVDIAYESNAVDLLKWMHDQSVAVEINLVSNEFILGVANEVHPLPLYRQYHVPYVISTDDPGVSRSSLTHEYMLYVTRYQPSYQELKQTVYNSIRYSFLSDAEKKSQLELLDKRFAQFETAYSQ